MKILPDTWRYHDLKLALRVAERELYALRGSPYTMPDDLAAGFEKVRNLRQETEDLYEKLKTAQIMRQMSLAIQ